MVDRADWDVDAGRVQRPMFHYPMAAMIAATALYFLAAAVGQASGSVVPLASAAGQMVATNGMVLASVLLAYKLLIVRLGPCPRDDLTLKGALSKTGLGVLIGFLLMAAAVGAAAVAHVYNLVGKGDSSALVFQLVTAAIMPGFMEEILFRGILFRWLEESAGSWAALVITSALFGFAHILNPHATWFSSAAIAVEAGLLLGASYMLTRSLWLPIGLHAAWNFTQGEIFGVPVSGSAVHGLLRSRLVGPQALSGGGFGLEASLIAIVIATAAGICFLWLAVRRGELVKPSWKRRSGAF